MIKRKLVLSTGNMNKLREIKDILKDLPIEVLSKGEVDLGHIDVEENGRSLEENSIKKAKELSQHTDYMVMADDSGLFVDALNGDPGVYSNRYAGEPGNDDANNIKLSEALKDEELENRSAKFMTVIALVLENKEVFTISGEVLGKIGFEKKGDNGFGYDPLFIPHGYEQTFAELGDDIKNKISHRARALEEMKKVLSQLLKDDNYEDYSSK